MPFSAYLEYGPMISENYLSGVPDLLGVIGDDKKQHKKDWENLVPENFLELLSGNHFCALSVYDRDDGYYIEKYHNFDNLSDAVLKAFKKLDPSTKDDPFYARHPSRRQHIREAREAMDEFCKYLVKHNRKAFQRSPKYIAKLESKIRQASDVKQLGDIALIDYFSVTSHAGPKRIELLESLLDKARKFDDKLPKRNELGLLGTDEYGFAQSMRQLNAYVDLRVAVFPEKPVTTGGNVVVMDFAATNGSWGMNYMRGKLLHGDDRLLFLFHEAEEIIQARIKARAVPQ